jgi:predicted ferric reductase
MRRRLAKVFHYGGCHSGCATAAVFWYLLYTTLATRDYANNTTGYRLANMITSWILITIFVLMLGGAHPKFRVKKHDVFEAMHRFAGWVAISTFWVHSMFAAKTVTEETCETLGLTLVKQPNFWFIIVSTSCSVISWGRLRRRDVVAEVLSDHATRLHFKYTNMSPFYGVKISNKPLTEWHAFATIPEDDGKGFSVVVSNAGDWTSSVIRNPPEKLWVRGYPLHGLLYTSRLFHKIVVVATGSGIGPCLSLLFADVTPRRILWSTPHPETTYGPKVMNAVLKADSKAVFIISNPKVTRKVVYGMQTRGIPAYGAIFDS